jgi:hypothetical protein
MIVNHDIQMGSIGGLNDEARVLDMTAKCEVLRKELDEVVAELDLPKVSDSPDDCDMEAK